MVAPLRSALVRSLRIVVVLLVGLAGYGLGLLDDRRAAAEGSATYEQLDVFAEVLGLVQTRYVEDIDDTELIRAGIRGMLTELDPHSVFLGPSQLRAMRDDTRGEYVGVGISIRESDGRILVGEVFEGGPAFDAGMRSDDVIISVDGNDATGLDSQGMVSRLRGPRGERVVIGIERETDAGPDQIEIPVIRDVIHTPAVVGSMPVEGIGVVRITSFQNNTGGELRSEIDSLQSEYGEELLGLVLDLRGNPGGLLNEAITVVDAFIPDGTIVSTGGRLNADETIARATRSGTRFRGPMVVLVDGGSASASEVVTGALQDYERATVVGTLTYGKGSVQSIIDLRDGSGLKLTISLYYTPLGRSINGEGITPDLTVLQATPAEGETDDMPTVATEAETVEDRQLQAALSLLLRQD
ncbi:MAG: carboxyl-terminal processing protease [Bradymonadia bacterium]